MDHRELAEGAAVVNAGGSKLGTIDRFVIAPGTGEVTHLVVRKGVLIGDDRLIPVDLVDRVVDGDVRLSQEVDLEDMPLYEQEHYADVDDATRERLDASFGSASMWRFPTVATGMYPGFPAYPSAFTTGIQPHAIREVNTPEGTVVVDEDTPVVSTNGEKVGSVAEMVVDDEGTLSHLVVDLGFLSGERVLPAHWISSINGGQVALAVGAEALDSLAQRP